MSSYPLRVGPHPMGLCPYKKMEIWTRRHRGHVKTGAGMGVMLPQAKEGLGLPGAGRGKTRILPWRFQQEHGPANTLISDFWLPELRDNKYLLFETTQFVELCMAALGNEYTRFIIQLFEFYLHVRAPTRKHFEFLKSSSVSKPLKCLS